MLNRAQIRAINAVRKILRKVAGKALTEERDYEAGNLAEACASAEKSLTNVLVLDRTLMAESEVTAADLVGDDADSE